MRFFPDNDSDTKDNEKEKQQSDDDGGLTKQTIRESVDPTLNRTSKFPK